MSRKPDDLAALLSLHPAHPELAGQVRTELRYGRVTRVHYDELGRVAAIYIPVHPHPTESHVN